MRRIYIYIYVIRSRKPARFFLTVRNLNVQFFYHHDISELPLEFKLHKDLRINMNTSYGTFTCLIINKFIICYDIGTWIKIVF